MTEFTLPIMKIVATNAAFEAFNNTICMTSIMPQPKLSHMFFGKKIHFQQLQAWALVFVIS